MIQQIQPYQQPRSYQSLQVEAMWFQNVVFVLLAIGMVAYFFKKGPANFFEQMWKE